MTTNEIEKAAAILRKGGLVAFPTETVYGLGADAKNPSALKKIFVAKQRPQDHPLIVHIADISQLSDWASDIPDEAYKLAKAFWPGPLSMIFKKAPGVSNLVTGDQETVAIRMPAHPIAQSLLRAFGGGLAAPSANRFGRISPTTAQAVKEELGDTVDMILSGGQCEVGVESTILALLGDKSVILRPGMITKGQIEKVLGYPLKEKNQDVPRTSGSHLSHYSPVTKTRLIGTEELIESWHDMQEKELPVAVVAWSGKFSSLEVGGSLRLVKMPENVEHYAHDLYCVLRELDKQKLSEIIIEDVPVGMEWEGVRDRIGRAAG